VLHTTTTCAIPHDQLDNAESRRVLARSCERLTQQCMPTMHANAQFRSCCRRRLAQQMRKCRGCAAASSRAPGARSTSAGAEGSSCRRTVTEGHAWHMQRMHCARRSSGRAAPRGGASLQPRSSQEGGAGEALRWHWPPLPASQRKPSVTGLQRSALSAPRTAPLATPRDCSAKVSLCGAAHCCIACMHTMHVPACGALQLRAHSQRLCRLVCGARRSREAEGGRQQRGRAGGSADSWGHHLRAELVRASTR
jgi:hypothetical protein